MELVLNIDRTDALAQPSLEPSRETLGISPLCDAVKEHFFRPELLKRVEAISTRGLMREGWFSAEMVYLFSELEKCQSMKSWESECLLNNRGKVDFRLRPSDEIVVIEVKAAPTRNKNGSPYPLSGYAN